MIKIDTKQWKQVQRELANVRERSIPFATRAALDATAFDARRSALAVIDKTMIMRNKFTQRSMRVEKVGRELNIDRQVAVFGSVANYMETQETGGTKTKKGSIGVPIPTSFASGEGLQAKPRKRLPRKPNKLSSISLTRRRVGNKSKKQENFLKVKQAVGAGQRYIYMDTGKNKGIYRIQGSGRPNKEGKLPRVKLRMVWNLKETSVTIPKNPWLKPSTDKAIKQLPSNYLKALRFQLKRLQR